MKILTQILRDFMSYFPEIESAFTGLSEEFLSEIIVKNIKLLVMHLKRTRLCDYLKSEKILNELNWRDQLENKLVLCDNGKSMENENEVSDIAIDNRHRFKKSFPNPKPKANRIIQRNNCRRYIIKKYDIGKNETVTGLVMQNMNLHKNCQIKQNFIGQVSANQIKSTNNLDTFLNDRNVSENYLDRLCTISLSPLVFSTVSGKVHNNAATVAEYFNENAFQSTELIDESPSEFLKNLNSLNRTTRRWGKNANIHEPYRMARGDDDTGLSEYSGNGSIETIGRKCSPTRTDSGDNDNASISLDFVALPYSDNWAPPIENRSDFTLNENESIDTETSRKSRLPNVRDTSPIEVSVANSVVDNSCRQRQPGQLGNLHNCLPSTVANDNEQFRLPLRLNLFCESLCDKYNLRNGDNVYHCDTEMSLSTKWSKLPDQTVSLYNAPSNRSDTVCEVVTGRCGGEKPDRPDRPNRMSVQFIENLSREMKNKAILKSSFLKPTISSKLKMKNPA